jgi:hypothetical protein
LVADDIVTWVVDNLVNILVISGMLAGLAKFVHHRVMQKIDEDRERLAQRLDDYIVDNEKKQKEIVDGLKELIENKFREALRDINRVDNLITQFILGGHKPS